jgi:uncharacterized protein YbjT (DUF2867 family)
MWVPNSSVPWPGAGEPVRALSRSGRADGQAPTAEAVAGDLNRPETVREALNGVEALFLMPGYGGQRQVLADARAAGVRRVVMLSGSRRARPPRATRPPAV